MLSVISSSSRLASTPCFCEQARDLDRELRVQERARGEVDGDAQLAALVLPHAHLLQRGVEHVGGQRRDQAGLLGDRDELRRADEAEPRVLPARERLDADDRARLELGLGLEEERDLAVLDRLAQAAGERQAARAEAVEARLEHRVPAAALLGGVHRDVGALDQRLHARAVRGVAGHADARVDLEREALDRERLAQAGEQLARDDVGVAGAAQLRQQHAELVAAEAGDRVVLAERLLEAVRDLLQQAVARVVAERVVDLLEVVEVDQHHGRGDVRAAPGGDRLLDAVAEERAVGQAGERVVQRLVLLGDRRAAAAVHGQERQQQQQQRGQAELRRQHHDGGEAEQHAGGRGLEEQVVGQVAAELDDALRERDDGRDERAVDDEEHGGDAEDRGQVLGAERQRRRAPGRP